MSGARFVGDGSRAPEVAMKDEHGSCYRPAEKDFAVSTDALVGEDAMGAFFNPVDNILAAARPEESHANTEECFVDAEVTADRAAMEDVKDEVGQGGGHDDEQGRSVGLQALADNDAAMVDAEVIVACELLEGRVELGDGGRAPGKTGGEVTGQRLGGRVRGAGSIPGGGRRKRFGGGCEATSNMRGGGSRSGRVLKEHSKRLGAKVVAVSGRQATAQAGDDRFGGQWRRL
jgi:hypothetical protein